MRSVSQIYSEAVAIRNNYLQITELNSGRSNSKLSMLNLMTYVVAVCIHTYEAILDVFQIRIAEVLRGRINGTPDWYALISKKFQYNGATELGDELIFNEDTMKVEYKVTDLSHRIIEKAAWETNVKDGTLILKVCKSNTNSNELNNGISYMQLNDNELTAFKMFIQQIKFVGANIRCESFPGDVITVVADERNPIFYNDAYVTKAQALNELQQSLINFSNEMKFNGMLYYQAVLDVIRNTEHIVEIGNSISVKIKSYDEKSGKYGDANEVQTRTKLKSGFVRFLDEDSIMTINESNITLVPASKMDEYFQSLEP